MARTHFETRYENDYIAKLGESNDGECLEVVWFKGEQIHRATFPASNLGSANRGEYLRAMVASIANQHIREALRSEGF